MCMSLTSLTQNGPTVNMAEDQQQDQDTTGERPLACPGDQ